MSFLPRQTASFGQANGPDVELVVEGDEWYSRHETLDGRPVVHDEEKGLFCHARLVDGRFESTGVPISEPPPPDAAPVHSRESREVIAETIRAREMARADRAAPSRSWDGPTGEEE